MLTTKMASNAAALAVSNAWRGGALVAETASASSSSTALASTAGFVDLCAKLAPAASLVLFLAPLPTIQKVARDKSVGDLPLLPYSSMTTNAFLWTVYGLLRNEFKVYFANGTGLFLAIYYFLRFAKFAPKSAPTLPGAVRQHFQATVAIMVGVVLAVLSPLPKPKAAKIVGTSAVAICLAMFASPLAALKTVIKKKSAESIPLPLSIATMINCFLWTVVGVFDLKDLHVTIPNGLGLFFGLVQLALIVAYRGGKSKDSDVVPVSV